MKFITSEHCLARQVSYLNKGEKMSVTINAKGTSTPYFKIGKRGTTLFQGSTDPSTLYEPIDGDIWINNATNSLSIKSANNWVAPILGVTNPLIFPVNSGNSGQVLSTDGEGNLTWISSSGSGTVTSASVVSANGFAGSVANSTTTPAITISTSVTGIIKGNGTAISSATAGTDYSAGTASLDTGILKTTTSTGNLTIAVASDFPTLNQNTTGTANNITGIVTTEHGGTGLTSFTANRIFYAGDANTLSQSSGLTYNGANTLVIGSSGTATVSAGAGESLRLGSNNSNNIIVLGAAGDLSFAGSVGTSGQVLTSQGANTSPTWATLTSGVSSFSAGTSGLTPNTATTGAVVLDGTLNISHGGTGAATANEAFNNFLPSQITNEGKYLKTDGTNTSWSAVTTGTVTSISVNGTPNNIISTGSPITSSGTITIDLANTSVVANTYTYASLTVDSYGRLTSATSNTPVTSFSAGTTGLTPNTATTGAVTLGGVLNVLNGGTGASILSGYVYSNGIDPFTANTTIPGSAITGAISGNANTATTLQTSRTIGATGDATWSVNFDGSSNVSSALTLATVNSSPQTDAFRKLTVNAKGLVTATSAVSQSDITTSLGYTPVNKAGDTMTGELVLFGDPTNALGAATKQYVDNGIAGLSWKTAVVAGTTANITLAGLQTIDGYTTLASDRILVKNQTTTADNGIYLASAGAWTRATDANTAAELNGAAVYVQNGTTLADTGWVQTTTIVTVGTTAVTWSQFSGSGAYVAGTGLSLVGNTFSNSGVLSVTGTTNQITTSASTGAITLSLPQNINSGAAPTFAGTNFTAIPNAALANSAVTVNGTAISLGSSGTVTAAAGTLTGITLNATVVNSSLTGVGTVTSGTWSGLFGAVSGANLTNIAAANIVGTLPSAVLGNTTIYVGTTAVTLNRASANQGLTGITSVAMPGATSGTITLTPAATAGTTAITIPATAGTLVTTGDSATVTNAMLAGSIANAKLANSAITIGTTAISLGSSNTTLAGLTSVSSTAFTGALTGNADTATTLQTSRTISATGDATWSVSFNGSANATAALTLATVATAGTYKSVTVDVKGRVTAGTNPTTLAGYGITDAVSNTGNSLPVTYGNISSAQLITSTTSANQIVDSFSASTYRTVKYLVQVTSSTSYQSSEIMIIHNGTTAFVSEYGIVMTNTSLASFDADVSGGNVRLLVTPTNAVTTINVVRTTIVV